MCHFQCPEVCHFRCPLTPASGGGLRMTPVPDWERNFPWLWAGTTWRLEGFAAGARPGDGDVAGVAVTRRKIEGRAAYPRRPSSASGATPPTATSTGPLRSAAAPPPTATPRRAPPPPPPAHARTATASPQAPPSRSRAPPMAPPAPRPAPRRHVRSRSVSPCHRRYYIPDHVTRPPPTIRTTGRSPRLDRTVAVRRPPIQSHGFQHRIGYLM